MDKAKAIEILNNFNSTGYERDKLEINPKGGFKLGYRYKKTLNEAIDTILKDIAKTELIKEEIQWRIMDNNIIMCENLRKSVQTNSISDSQNYREIAFMANGKKEALESVLKNWEELYFEYKI